MGNKSSSASDEGFDETKDLEAANPTTLNEHFSCADANANRDPVLITWSGPDDLENPKNWQNAPARQDLDKALGMHSDIERYLSMAIVILTYSIGPIFFGPSSELYGRYSTWRWVFWATSAAAVGVQVAGLIWLRECHLSTILRKRRDALVQKTGNHNRHTDQKVEKLVYKLLPAFERPVILFTTQPIVFCMAIYMAYLFGVTSGGLNCLFIATGSFAGLLFNLKMVDRIYRTPKVRNNNVGKPEYRIPSLALGSVVSTIGLFWYGWSIGHTHWIMSNIGALIFTTGTISCLQGMQTYIVDSYETYAACAILRSQCSFGFPLFAPSMYSSLGYGWCKSVQAFIAMAIGWSAPFAFYFFWHKLRTASRHAAD
ncbi:MFS multidrug transporter, putative [Penicillium digitatum PHI26]|uniref:MFS multidrug transporter, putative n=2 Tax=Penicillium digitatum TaxID=36651 RepID=K9FMP4_PEND2|nr:MFS multidrug transporter, putative [Penicillium digitatum Pd1]EKV08081.1 MFS multidrug transporter, putative [Penicillium digitatum Pd1]EKV09622.1 MFS multidrug transporter, putative [Penicillium digitatum PHI26]